MNREEKDSDVMERTGEKAKKGMTWRGQENEKKWIKWRGQERRQGKG
jgi:hypothetical protein